MGKIAITLASTAVDGEELGKIMPVVKRVVELKWDHMVTVSGRILDEDGEEGGN